MKSVAVLITILVIIGTVGCTENSDDENEDQEEETGYGNLTFYIWLNSGITGVNYSVLIPLPLESEVWNNITKNDSPSPYWDNVTWYSTEVFVSEKGTMLNISCDGNITFEGEWSPEYLVKSNLSLTTQEMNKCWIYKENNTLDLQIMFIFMGFEYYTHNTEYWDSTTLVKNQSVVRYPYDTAGGPWIEDFVHENKGVHLQNGWNQYDLRYGSFHIIW